MISTQHTQSLTDFRQRINETFDRLNQTGEAEVITVNGQARAVLVPPAVYDDLARARQLEIERDVVAIRRAMTEFDEGKGRPAEEFFDELRGKLLAIKAEREKAAT